MNFQTASSSHIRTNSNPILNKTSPPPDPHPSTPSYPILSELRPAQGRSHLIHTFPSRSSPAKIKNCPFPEDPNFDMDLDLDLDLDLDREQRKLETPI